MTKLPARTQAEFCSTLVDEWARAGAHTAVVSPGSRSAPMALALIADDRLDVSVRLDERSAGFMALGAGLASGVPAVVLTTSGTAAAELHPAVVEADLARVPLIVCTADRPPELQGVGAPQTIEQRGLYGGSLRWSLEAGVPDEAARATWRSLGSRVFAEAVAGPSGPGPVHVNLAFREPLLAPAGSRVELPPGRPDGRPWHRVVPAARVPDARLLEDLGPLLDPSRRGVIVAGARCGDPESVLAAAALLGWPVLADPRSGCRRAIRPVFTGGSTPANGPRPPEATEPATGGCPQPAPVVVAAADALLRDDSFRAAHRPEVILRLGEPAASKVLAGWFADTAAGGTVHVVADPDWSWRDPGREAALHVPSDPGELAAWVVKSGAEAATRPLRDWAGSWAAAEEAAQRAIDAVLAGNDELTEPFVARHVSQCERIATIVVASSMPVRDLEWFAKPVDRPPRVLSNRGANGIDGVASTTLGVAAAGSGPTVAILGDLAFLHDLTAFVSPVTLEARPPCVFVVVDNCGGGIFSFLPQASQLDEERFERLFGTPQRPEVASVARSLGATVMEAGTRHGFEQTFTRALDSVTFASGAEPGPVVVVARTDRERNVQVHDDLNAAVRGALVDAGGDPVE
jgi:2-succinyl-5-enolpyruvyl-6-hydroxy-3-cyclohexene-1-carboxylate synthase